MTAIAMIDCSGACLPQEITSSFCKQTSAYQCRSESTVEDSPHLQNPLRLPASTLTNPDNNVSAQTVQQVHGCNVTIHSTASTACTLAQAACESLRA